MLFHVSFYAAGFIHARQYHAKGTAITFSSDMLCRDPSTIVLPSQPYFDHFTVKISREVVGEYFAKVENLGEQDCYVNNIPLQAKTIVFVKPEDFIDIGFVHIVVSPLGENMGVESAPASAYHHMMDDLTQTFKDTPTVDLGFMEHDHSSDSLEDLHVEYLDVLVNPHHARVFPLRKDPSSALTEEDTQLLHHSREASIYDLIDGELTFDDFLRSIGDQYPDVLNECEDRGEEILKLFSPKISAN